MVRCSKKLMLPNYRKTNSLRTEMKSILIKAIFSWVAAIAIVMIFVGCDLFGVQNDLNKDTQAITKSENLEELLYSSEAELDAICSRAIGDIVDWKLAHEFAEIAFEEMIADGSFPIDAYLRELPITVYNSDGILKYYEFRINSADNMPLGAITTVARETDGYPIAFRLLFPSTYSDTLEMLFNQKVITEDDLLRVVTNDYPDYAIGVISTTRGSYQVDTIYDPTTGEELSKDHVKEPIGLDVLILENPEYAVKLSQEISEMNAYKQEISEFWEEANTRKGALLDSVTRKTYETNYVPGYNSVQNNSWLRGWCGPSSVNFVLGYMNYRGLVTYNPYSESAYLAMESALERLSWGPVMPWKIQSGIAKFAPNYKVVSSGWNIGSLTSLFVSLFSGNPIPAIIGMVYDSSNVWDAIKRSINSDQIPGISLRGIRWGGWQPHYRNVAGYRVTGWDWWFIHYRQNEMYIHDQNQHDHGRWESYNPIYHWQYFRITKK